MKKKLFIIAAAALTLGMTACTDDVIDPIEVITDGTEITDGIAIKSTADLIGTEWNYTMEDMVFVDEYGDTTAILELSNLVFTLSFDSTVAQLAFPEEVSMMSMTEEDGEYTLAEVAQMHFAYTYDLATTSGMLTATDLDITGEVIDMEIPFTYDATNDDIIINLPIAFDEESTTGIELVLTRN